MTTQVPENLILNGKMRSMLSFPHLIDDPNIITVLSREEFEKERREKFKKENQEELDRRYRKRPTPHDYIMSTACWRRYIGTWEIKDGKFYLINLEGHVKLTKKEPVHATWFSGVLKVPEGTRLPYSLGDYSIIYEKEIHIMVENGIVMGQTIIDNRKSIDGYKIKSRIIAHDLGLSVEAQFKAVRIIEEASNNGLTSGRNPAGVAAAAVYIASALVDERKTQRDVAEIAGVSEVTIRKRCKELTEQLETSINLQLLDV